MRNHKFRFPSMIPSEWFHKLKNMSKLRKKHYPPPPLYSFNTTKKRNPYSSECKSLPHPSRSCFSNRSSHTSIESKILQISPRNSRHMIQSKRKSLYKSSPSSSSFASPGFNKKNIKFQPKQDSPSSASFDDQKRLSSHFSNLKFSSSADDIIMEMNQKGLKKKKFKEMNSTEKACPASNRTKESRKTHHLSMKVNNKEKEKEGEKEASRIQKKHQVSSGKRSPAKSPPRIKLRVNSPKIQVSARKSNTSRSQSIKVLDSFAVIKRSVDPKKDFRESMVEMIEQNNIRAPQDLEDLLTCYLSLNPKEYHDLIIEVFVQVWLEVINT